MSETENTIDESTLFDAIKLEAELKRSPPIPFDNAKAELTENVKKTKHIDWEKHANDREKYRLPNGELRPASLDMGLDDRALRTLSFASLIRSELEQIHEYEQKHLWNRFIMAGEIRKLLKRSDYMGARCTKEQLDYLRDICLRNRPRMFQDDYDNEFEGDGMNFHHAWDWTMWNMTLDLPDPQARKVTNLKHFERNDYKTRQSGE